jgi:two-component system response regulator MprA
MRILIAEDKRALAAHIGRVLESEGHDITLTYDGEEALRLTRTNNFDLLLLDVMLPRRDGFSVVRQMREDRMRMQTIIASARDSIQDIIGGLDAGADDYLTKPFPLDVLLAKVRAAGRRLPAQTPQEVRFEDLVLRPHHFELQRGTRIVPLTRTECALLEVMMRRAGTVVPHQVLLEEGWGSDSDATYDRLYVFIRALRAKITQPGEADLLHTIRGVGYSFRPASC